MKNNTIEEMHKTFAKIKKENLSNYNVSHFSFANKDVSTEIIGNELAKQIYRPFAHLQNNNAPKNCQLKIKLWDELLVSNHINIESLDLGKSWEAHDGAFFVSNDSRYTTFIYNGSLMSLDIEEETIIGFRKSGSALSRYEISKPFLALFSIWYHKNEIQLLHAGLLSYKNKGVLFPGSGGSGKSTSTLSCTLGGFKYLADDFMGLEINKDMLRGYSIYCSAAIATENLQRFPSVFPYAEKEYLPVEDKASLFIAEIPFCETAQSVSIDYIMMPKITHKDTSRITKATPVEALLRLAPSSLFFVLPRPGKEAFEKMSKLVEKVPAYWLEFGYDIENVPLLIKELLDEK